VSSRRDALERPGFIVSDDVERSRRFYTEVLGGEVVRDGEPSFVALANSCRLDARGAEFLTPPQDRGAEIRCYLRDPDGHLIEVGQATGAAQHQGQ
jgi:catechol 2,3-dioxygenase-like lactoylglutathione lyase family enzyme